MNENQFDLAQRWQIGPEDERYNHNTAHDLSLKQFAMMVLRVPSQRQWKILEKLSATHKRTALWRNYNILVEMDTHTIIKQIWPYFGFAISFY
jgi:hypothetical protein